MELAVDPGIDAAADDAVDVAGARAEAEAVECVKRALPFGQLRIGNAETEEREG
jgi:hypothetical protein